MPAAQPPDKLYQALMQLHQDSFEEGRFEVAYHTLAAALHAAEEINNAELLTTIQSLATKRQAEIDRIWPEHKVSSASARRRGNHPLFTALAATTGAARGRITAEQAVARVRHGSGEAR